MKLYENTTNSMRNNPEYYEKWLSVILFLIHHLSDNKRVIPIVSSILLLLEGGVPVGGGGR